MHFNQSIRLAVLALASATSAQSLIESLSFGQRTPLSADGHSIEGWELRSSQDHQLNILSDRIIVTPPWPGNTRGALWQRSPSYGQSWSAEVEFRASGQDVGTGNLQIWYVSNKDSVKLESVYSVEKFDGFALVIDQYGNTGGKIRGFLNDGSQDFRSNPALESLAFGHCDYHYRNLGRPSTLRITNHNGLKVEIDGQECFSSDRINLPPAYYFGLTSVTGDNPDTFEVNKFLISTPDGAAANHNEARPDHYQPHHDPPTLTKLDRLPGAPEIMPDRAADEISRQEDQFADVHNRLQSMMHQITEIFAEFDALSHHLDDRHNELRANLPQFPAEKMDAMSRRIEGIERVVLQVQRDVESRDYREKIDKLQHSLDTVRGGLSGEVLDGVSHLVHAAAPRMGLIIFIMVVVQVALMGAYVFYKKRVSVPKKYL